MPPGGPYRPPGNSSSTVAALVCGGLVLTLLAVLGLGFVAGWFDDDKNKNDDRASSEAASDGASDGESERRGRDPGAGGSDDSAGADADADPDGSTGSGGSAGSGRNRPAPDPSASAFQRVKAGNCLTVYDTGRGGSGSVAWSSDTPPAAVDCSSTDALMHVSRVTSSASSCATGTDKAWWSYNGADGSSTVLCLTRQYHKNYCLLGTQNGSGQSATVRIGQLTAVDCKAKKVPKPYNQVMRITGVYRATAGTDANSCVRAQGDQTLYYAWKVNEGKTLLCTMIYRGS
ncbi:hypothetical protein JGS22_008210 [Streptomyces sp. P38-E01]|uniref:Uncharacterized protein n=1 Tax=Streptomyces tardus TaxID=2780544 RepID=A0A949N1B0_9ACTN|nr:hypothetical protein [Streptomyces tardus]MBU7597605.1 hypothetical protein [Streptomyces tardus]